MGLKIFCVSVAIIASAIGDPNDIRNQDYSQDYITEEQISTKQEGDQNFQMNPSNPNISQPGPPRQPAIFVSQPANGAENQPIFLSQPSNQQAILVKQPDQYPVVLKQDPNQQTILLTPPQQVFTAQPSNQQGYLINQQDNQQNGNNPIVLQQPNQQPTIWLVQPSAQGNQNQPANQQPVFIEQPNQPVIYVPAQPNQQGIFINQQPDQQGAYQPSNKQPILNDNPQNVVWVTLQPKQAILLNQQSNQPYLNQPTVNTPNQPALISNPGKRNILVVPMNNPTYTN